jgi:hypothetical protein
MSIYDDFFNLEEPCPDSIQDCAQLRDAYKKELSKAPEVCSGCDLLRIKSEFMTEVWKAYLAKLGY